MKTDRIADLLQARAAGPGRWMCRCPAHNDRSPSLSIREACGGRTLLHCFAGCDVHAIVGAVGLDMADLRGETGLQVRVASLPEFRNPQREQLRRQYRELAAAYRSLYRAFDALTERLVHVPERSQEQNDLAAFFHCDLERLREMEDRLDELNQVLTETR